MLHAQWPLAAFARISEYYRLILDADRGYVGVLAHNPLDSAHYQTAWLRPAPFSLMELGTALPPGWRRPPGATTRVVSELMRFAGSPRWTDDQVRRRGSGVHGTAGCHGPRLPGAATRAG